MLEEFMPFVGLIIFGNIENLILASQGVVAGVNPKVLGLLSIFAVVVWLFIGFVATDVAMQYSQYITFLGGSVHGYTPQPSVSGFTVICKCTVIRGNIIAVYNKYVNQEDRFYLILPEYSSFRRQRTKNPLS